MHNPTGSAQQVLPLLQSAKNPLRYLTPNDWALMIDRAKRLSFKKAEKLVSQGKQARTLYVLAAGKVSITVSATRIAQIGPGEICGEMAFLEDSIASATATAEGEVEAYALEWSILQDLFELGFGAAFLFAAAVDLSTGASGSAYNGSDGRSLPSPKQSTQDGSDCGAASDVFRGAFVGAQSTRRGFSLSTGDRIATAIDG